MANPKVSIVVPVYNNEGFISDCIESLINQTYKNTEIVLVDDGSTDASLAICKEYAKKNNNIKVCTQKNSGTSAARSLGIKESSGDYIMFVDSDDFITKDAISKLMNCFEQNGVDIIRFQGQYYPNKKAFERINKSMSLPREQVVRLLLLTDRLSSVCLQIYRKECFDNLSVSESVSCCEDYLLNQQIQKRDWKVYVLKDVLYQYRLNSSSTTKTNDTGRLKNNIHERLYACNKTLQFMAGCNEIDEHTKQIAKGFQIERARRDIFKYIRCVPKNKRVEELKKILDSEIYKTLLKEISIDDVKKYKNTLSFARRVLTGKTLELLYKCDASSAMKAASRFEALASAKARKAKVKKIGRTDAFKNSLSTVIGNVVKIGVNFVAQKIFLDSLGLEYSGLNGILTNIIAALNIAELGVGIAVTYNMYEPIKKKQTETVRALMKFYKKAYDVIALIVTVAGIVVMPFLHLIIRDEIPGVNIYFAYLIVLFGAATSYLLSYRQSLLYAMQNGRITTNVQTIGNVVIAGLQALLLIYTKNFYLYLAAKIAIQFIENIFLFRITKRKYPEYCEKAVNRLDKKIEKDIFKKMRALFVHKASSFVIFSTDNIIISSFINVATVGLYSNYHMITSALETVFAQAIKALTPTVGHLLVDKDQKKNYKVFKKIRNVNFAMAMLSSVGLMALADLFIRLWIGKEYILPDYTLAILVAVHFQRVMRESFAVFKEAAGIYYEDRYVPIIESAINIVASILLVMWIGLPGVFIGTFLSSLVLWCYSYPKFVYKKLFGRTYKQYAVEVFLYALIFAAAMMIISVIKSII